MKPSALSTMLGPFRSDLVCETFSYESNNRLLKLKSNYNDLLYFEFFVLLIVILCLSLCKKKNMPFIYANVYASSLQLKNSLKLKVDLKPTEKNGKR